MFHLKRHGQKNITAWTQDKRSTGQ